MIIPHPYLCDICRAPKGETNHWYIAFAGDGLIQVGVWDDANANRPDARHLCGHEHVLTFVSAELPTLYRKETHAEESPTKQP